jgi:hypothetical protein
MGLFINCNFFLRSFLLLICLVFGSAYSKSAEFVLLNGVVSWNADDQDAFWSIMPDETMPSNWSSPDDFYNGLIYTRYEILSVASNAPCGIQFGIFQWIPDKIQRRTCGELCENIRSLNNGVGSVAIDRKSVV